MTIPSNLRTPFMFIEFDSSRAFQGPAILEYKGLMIGNRLAAGTKAEKRIDLVTSADQADEFYGAGSVLAKMIRSWFSNNNTTPLYVASLDDNVSGVAATGTIAIVGTASADGTLSLYIAGKRLAIAVSNGDTPTDIGDAIDTAVAADSSLPVTSSNSTGTVTFTAKNKGETGNNIDIRVNYADGEVLPSGVTGATVTPMASGANNPDIQDIIDILGDEWYQIICSPYADTTNLTAIETELADRFGPTRMIDGMYVTSKADTVANLATFGNSRNSPHVTCIHSQKVLQTPWEVASAYAGRISAEGSADPARPFQTLELVGILPPAVTERFTQTENNTLLYDGISTFTVDTASKVRIQRAITMYQKNAAGATDIAYLDVNTLLTLMYLRYDFRNMMLTKYPRAKLADDGVRVQPGMSIITPKIGKSEAIAKFRQWEFLGLVENIDQFKNDLVVTRNVSDPNRLDFILPPDLINQFRVGGVTVQFLLQSPSI